MSEGISQPDQPVVNSKGTASDLFSKFDDLIQMREGLLASGVEDPFNLVMEKVLSPTRAICNGRDTILLGTYNYMGMTFDPDVVEAGKQALADFGSGTTGSRVLNGTYQGHKECEDALKRILRHGSCHGFLDRLPSQSRYHLPRSPARAITLCSTSIATPRSGMVARWAMPRSYHSSTTTSRRWRSAFAAFPEGAGKLVVLEGVYSMLGDIAPLKEMVAIAKKYGAMVLVDEAHSMGFIGENGRGVVEDGRA